jgi:hypothetical protein
MKEAPGSSETSVLTRTTRRNNPEDTILHVFITVLSPVLVLDSAVDQADIRLFLIVVSRVHLRDSPCFIPAVNEMIRSPSTDGFPRQLPFNKFLHFDFIKGWYNISG